MIPAVLIGVLMISVPMGAAAEEKAVAKVNGAAITEKDIELAEREIGSQFDRLPPQYQVPEIRRRMIVEFLIENQLLAEAGRKKNLTSAQSYTDRMAYWDRRSMREAFFENEVRSTITDDDLRRFYDAEARQYDGAIQIRASHILVKTEDKAKEIVELIAHDGDFAALARQHSTGPSGPSGGDLGYFGQGQMVPEFDKAAFALKVGEVSQPVKTQYGWHVIKVVDRRETKMPPFEQVKDGLLLRLARDKVKELTAKLRDGAKIEYLDKSMAQ